MGCMGRYCVLAVDLYNIVENIHILCVHFVVNLSNREGQKVKKGVLFYHITSKK